MKIGVVTFHRAINLGGVLQAFALQYFLKERGFQSEIIDYRCPVLEKQYYSRQLDWKKLKKIASAIVRNGVLKRNTSKFDDFRIDHLPISDTVYYPSNIGAANDKYDVFVTGSDQVWSWDCAGFDKAYFLDFVTKPNTKLAYAASFGGASVPKEFEHDYQKLLMDFDDITVREAVGTEIVGSVAARSASIVLDPTLLIQQSIWRKELVDSSSIERPYLLVYMIAECKELLTLAKKVAKKKNLEIVYVSDRIYKPSGVTSKRNVGPKEFVTLVSGSEAVVTNSYHGICFSLIFRKELFVGFLRQNIKVNARLLYVIKKYRLEERLIDSEVFSVDSKIDFDFIEGSLIDERRKSVEWANKWLASSNSSGTS